MLDGMSPKERVQKIESCRVFARVTPKHKNVIVKALQSRGNVVAMTGDGINDAPCIKSADIGIAMGKSGTDVTKSASDMVIDDDNFATIVSAVREGRRIFANIKKTISFFLATNLAEVLSILIASIAFARHSFLLSTQLLWINLITDTFPVLAFGVEQGDDDIMKRPPLRAEKALLSKDTLWKVLLFGLYMTAATIGVYALFLVKWGNAAATSATFLTVSFLELFHAFNVRGEGKLTFRTIFQNKVLLLTVTAGVVVNVALMCITPLSSLFGLCALNGVQWAIVWGVSLSVLLFGWLVGTINRICSRKRVRGGKA
jgi:Ca2+-transporting ATPase